MSRTSRRLKRTTLPATGLLAVLRGEAIIRGWPEDAVLIRVGWGFSSDGLEIILEHPGFDPVPDGTEIPYLMPSIYYFDEDRVKAFMALLVEDRLRGLGGA